MLDVGWMDGRRLNSISQPLPVFSYTSPNPHSNANQSQKPRQTSLKNFPSKPTNNTKPQTNVKACTSPHDQKNKLSRSAPLRASQNISEAFSPKTSPRSSEPAGARSRPSSEAPEPRYARHRLCSLPPFKNYNGTPIYSHTPSPPVLCGGEILSQLQIKTGKKRKPKDTTVLRLSVQAVPEGMLAVLAA